MFQQCLIDVILPPLQDILVSIFLCFTWHFSLAMYSTAPVTALSKVIYQAVCDREDGRDLKQSVWFVRWDNG